MKLSTPPQLALWQEHAVEEWAVRQSRRARRLCVRVLRTGKVEVIVPRRTSPHAVAQFIDEHRQWIERKRIESLRSLPPVEPFPPESIELAACEERWRLHLGAGRARARLEAIAPGLLSLTGDLEDARAVHAALRRWLVVKAQETLAPLLAATAREFGFSYSRVVVRRQRTRWGSCSRRGTISLNCTLLFQRPEVVRYLLIHELAHTQHMNHSRRFRACVASCCPQYRRLDQELRDGWRNVPEWVLEP
jgi:predicted metal-dependent hydrolase